MVFFVRRKNNENIDKYNEVLEKVATKLSGVFDNNVVFLNNILETKDISNDGVHPSVSHGIHKVVRNIWNFYVHLWLTLSETEIKPRIIKRNFGKIFDHYDNNNFLVYIQNKHIYLQLIINLADGLLKYRKMLLFLTFFIFSILMGRRNHSEFHKQTFETYYCNKPNFCYFFKTVDSYNFVFFLKLLVFWSIVRLMLSGDMELNPEPHLENLIEYSSYLKNRGSNQLLFSFFNVKA